MADGRLLAGVRRFWTTEDVEAAYRAVLAAYGDKITQEVTITGADFDGQHSSGQYVLDRAAMVGWLDVLEERMQELEDIAEGISGTGNGGCASADFRWRRVGT